MTLRKQLLLVSLLMLALPWAGCQFVKEMETVLRDNQKIVLETAVRPIALQLAKHIEPIATDKPVFYAPLRHSAVTIDGYDDDWQDFPAIDIPSQHDGAASYRSAISDQYLKVLIEVPDVQIMYFNPGAPHAKTYDFLRLTTDKKNDAFTWDFFTSAPGTLTARRLIKNDQTYQSTPNIEAYWQETMTGYNVELSIPLSLMGEHIALIIFNTDNKKVQALSFYDLPKTALLYPDTALAETIAPFINTRWDTAITDKQGWPLSPQPSWLDLHTVQPDTGRSALFDQLLGRVYRFFIDSATPTQFAQQWPLPNHVLSHSTTRLPIENLLAEHQQLTNSRWYADNINHTSILSIIKPVFLDRLTTDQSRQEPVAYVLLTQSSDALLAITNNALRRVINLSLGTTAIATLGFFLYASFLSFRIRKLRDATERAVSEDGQIKTYQASHSQDELGDLSRSYGQLLHRVADYNLYLQTLSGKLAHELRTPLTITKSSLEMLHTAQGADQQAHYLKRAEEGTERLRIILNAISESSRVEHNIQQLEHHAFDLSQLIEDITQAYQDSYSSHYFVADINAVHQPLNGNPELIVQMLDKLVDNARDFAPLDSTITIGLKQQCDQTVLSVSNNGPLLPDSMQHQLFDSLVSIRSTQNSTETPHLGFGLYIVRLIADSHRASVRAYNQQAMTGVVFEVTFG